MAGSLNRAMLIGRLGKDVKLTYLPSGQAVAEMSVATDESYKDREGNKVDRTEWHRVKCFGKVAEFCNNYLGKGRLVYIDGKLQTRSWEDQQGQTRYVTEITASNVQALDPKPQGQDQGQPDRQQQPARGNQNSAPQRHDDGQGPAFPSEASGMDDVPF